MGEDFLCPCLLVDILFSQLINLKNAELNKFSLCILNES